MFVISFFYFSQGTLTPSPTTTFVQVDESPSFSRKRRVRQKTSSRIHTSSSKARTKLFANNQHPTKRLVKSGNQVINIFPTDTEVNIDESNR